MCALIGLCCALIGLCCCVSAVAGYSAAASSGHAYAAEPFHNRGVPTRFCNACVYVIVVRVAAVHVVVTCLFFLWFSLVQEHGLAIASVTHTPSLIGMVVGLVGLGIVELLLVWQVCAS